MLELLQYFGLPVGISSVSGRIDEIIVIVHYLMLVLFIGWGIFFIVSLVKFRASKNIKANYKGVESHYSSVMEAAVAVIEIVILFGLSGTKHLKKCLAEKKLMLYTHLIGMLKTDISLMRILLN